MDGAEQARPDPRAKDGNQGDEEEKVDGKRPKPQIERSVGSEEGEGEVDELREGCGLLWLLTCLLADVRCCRCDQCYGRRPGRLPSR